MYPTLAAFQVRRVWAALALGVIVHTVAGCRGEFMLGDSPPLTPGTYTGQSTITVRVTSGDLTESQTESRPYTVEISDDGLPVRGAELEEGAQYSRTIGNFGMRFTVTSITTTIGDVRIEYNANATVNGQTISGSGSERFEDRGGGAIRNSFFVTLADDANTGEVVIEISGTLER